MTFQDVFESTISWSLKEAPEGVTVSDAEAVMIINNGCDGLFLFGSRFNPEYFGQVTPVVGVAGVWDHPVNALLLFHRTDSNGDPVRVVSAMQSSAAHPEPAVRLLGRSYVANGLANDPAGNDTLNLWSVRAPAVGADLADTVDELIIDNFRDLLALETAMHLAIKDNRTEEVDRIRPLRDKWALRWGAYVEAYSVGQTRLWDYGFASPNLIGINSILAGGSQIETAAAGG